MGSSPTAGTKSFGSSPDTWVIQCTQYGVTDRGRERGVGAVQFFPELPFDGQPDRVASRNYYHVLWERAFWDADSPTPFCTADTSIYCSFASTNPTIATQPNKPTYRCLQDRHQKVSRCADEILQGRIVWFPWQTSHKVAIIPTSAINAKVRVPGPCRTTLVRFRGVSL